MSDDKKKAKWNLSKNEKKKLSPLKGKDNVHVRLDKIQPQKGVRQTGINRAWRQEKELVEKTGRGTRNWTKKQLKELTTKGKVTGFKGHHIVNVKSDASLAGDPRNIVFVSKKEHELVHGKNFKNDTQGRGIDRKAMIKQHENNLGVRKPVGEKLAEAEARALQRVKLRPEQAQQLTQKVEDLGARLKPGLEKAKRLAKFAGIAEDVKEFWEADDKVMAGAKIIGKKVGARVGATVGGAVGAPFGGVGAPIGAAAGYIGGEYAGEYLAEKGVNLVRKVKNKVMQVIGEETQELAPENKPLELELVKKVVVYYSSDDEITLPVAFDDDLSEDIPPPPKKNHLPKPAKPKQTKDELETDEDEEFVAGLGQEDLEEIEALEEGGVIVDQYLEEVGEELTQEDVDGVKAIFSEELERDLFDVAEFVTDNFLPDNDTKKVVQGALDCYAFARGHKDITDPMAVAGALVNYLPPELQKIASPVLKGVRAAKTMADMADKLQNGLDAIQLADVTDVLGLVAMIPGIPPEVSAVIGVISAAAKLASLLAAGTAPILPVALAVASLLLALHKMFDLFSGLGGGGGDGDGDGDGGGDGDDDGKDDADADDAQPDEGQPDPTPQPGDGNAPGNAPGYGQAPGQQPGDGQGESAVQQPPQGPHHPNKPGQHPNKQDQKPNQQPQQQKDLQPPSSDQQPQEQELPNPPRNDQKPEQGQQHDRHVPPLNDQQPHQDQRQPQPKPQRPPRPEPNTAEAKGEGQEEDKLKDDKNSREEEPFGEKKQRDLPHQSKEDMNQKRPSVERRPKDTSEISEKDESNGMEFDDNSISPSDGEGDALTGSDEGSDDLEGETGSEQGFEELEGKHGDFEEDFEDHTGEYAGSEEDLEGLFEGSELAPIDAAELDYTDLLTSDSKKSEQKSSRNKKKMASDQKGDGEDSVGEGSAEKDSQALSDFDGEEFDLEPFLTEREKFKAKPNAKDANKLEDSDYDINYGSDIGEFDDDARSGSEEGNGGSDVEGGSTTSQDTINAPEDARMDIDNPTEFRNYAEDEVDDAADHSGDEAEDDGDYESFVEDLENKLEEDFTEEQIAEARERLKEAKEGVSSNATVWAKIDAMCQFIEEVDYVSAILNDDTAFVAAQKQLLLAYTHYNAHRDEWLQRERVQRREAPRVKEVTEDDVEDAESEHINELEDSLSEIIDAAVNLLDESDLDELEDFDENDFSDDFDESFGDEEQGSGEDENPNLEHVGKIVGHRTMDDDPGKGKAIYRPSAPKLKHRKFNQDEEPEGVIFKENFDEHQHEFMKQVSDRAFYEVRQTETADKNSLSSTVVSKEKSFKQLVSGEVPSTLKSLLSEEHVQTLSSLTKGNAAFSQAVLELLGDVISAVEHIELLIKFWKPLAKLFVISDGIFPQQFLGLQPFMNKLADVLASQEYQQFVKILPDLEALAEQTSALKFDLDMKSEEEEKSPIEKDNRDVVERILCKGMAASDEVATVNCLESPLDFQGIHYSDDISHILPIHALQLDNPDLEMMFWRDFTEKRLVTYEHDGGVIDDSNNDYAQMPRAKETLNYLVNERAPFVVCLNTPIKMEKNEELAVKLLVLNIMRQCLIERRTAVVFGFTSKDLPNDVQKHVLKPDFDGLIQLIGICQATFDRSESFHEGYAWTTCEHAPLHSCALLLNEMEVKGRPMLAEVFITSLGITALSWPYSVLPSNGKLLVHLVEPNTTNYCSAVLENDTYTVLVEPKKISDLPVVAFIDGKSRYAQGVDHYRAEDSAGKDIHQLFWDGCDTGESSSVCLAFDHSTGFVFNTNINLDQFATKGASPFINALTQQRTVANVEKALASLTTFGNSDEISISSNVLVHHTSLVSLPTINYCCPLIHHVDIEELLTHPINSATIKEHMELWLKADAGVSKPEWHWQDQSTKQRDVNDITENDSQLPVLKHNEANQQRYIQFTANTHYAVNDLPELPVEVLIVNEKQSLPVTLSREVVPFNSLSVFPTAKVNSLNLQGEFINVYEIVVLRQGSPAECIDILTKYLKKKYNV